MRDEDRGAPVGAQQPATGTGTQAHGSLNVPPGPEGPSPSSHRPRSRVPYAIAAGVAGVLVLGGYMFHRAQARENHVALASQPKGVTAIVARPTNFRQTRSYIGTIEPWVEAKLGPQYISAYVDTVLVRPGAAVKRGQVVASLDCRNASAASKAIAMQARALQATQEALAHEAARVSGLLHGGFVSPNEAEVKTAASQTKEAELLAAKAQLLKASLDVSDCVLRSPFDGEVADRKMDPGAFARPGSEIVSVVDRTTVRVTADVPEVDFDVVAPGTPVDVQVLANGNHLVGRIARRSPAADLSTRTVHCEIDVPDPKREIPVGTTAELTVGVGQPVPALEVPLGAASVRDRTASLFVVQDGVARKVTTTVLGESEGQLYLEPTIPAGSSVVLEGRGTLHDGDRVTAVIEQPTAAPTVFQSPPPAAPETATTAARPAHGGRR